MKQPVETVAANLQRLREERNLSLSALADLTGVSKSMLRQIEVGESSPTVATLWKIANGLRVPFTALIRDREPGVTIGSFTAGELLTGDTEGYRLYPLIVFDPERNYEAYYAEIDPGVHLDAEPHQGDAEEHVFVLGGAIDMTVGEDTHRIAAQQYISFQATVHHHYHNAGADMATAIMLISYRA